MNISIPPELEQFVQAKVESGMYQSAGELFREALHLLVERDELKRRRVEAMDRFIQEGLDAAERGEFIDPDELWAELDQVIEDAARKHA
jgi:antitoxin ParD1/3/4